MTRARQNSNFDLNEQLCKIISAYVSKNRVPQRDLPNLIGYVHATLERLSKGAAATTDVEDNKPSARQVRKSITPNALVSFIDGRSYKTLKRHLAGHGYDPLSYRKRYGLPDNYPLVAPNYAEHRSQIAKSIGLGTRNNAIIKRVVKTNK